MERQGTGEAAGAMAKLQAVLRQNGGILSDDDIVEANRPSER